MMADVLNQCAPAEVINQELREDNWGDLGDQEQLRYEILKAKHITSDLCMNISKLGIDCINIELYNPKQFVENEQMMNPGMLGLSLKSKQQISSPHDDHANIQMMKFSINASQRNKFFSKLLKVKDHEISRVLVLTCDLRDPQEINIKIIELLSSTVMQSEEELRKLKPKILYQYRFKEKKMSNFGTGIALNLERRNLQEALAEVVTSGLAGSMSAQVVERAGTIYQYITKQNQKKPELHVFTEGISLTQRRLIATAGVQSGIRGDKQTLILHRKTFYDEPHEKLIIVSVSIECTLNRRKGHGPAQMCLQDINTFKLNIHEPETQRKMDFDIKISKCFLEEEIMGGINLKNVNHLKKMAKVLVEERAIIKRVNTANRGDDNMTQDNLYTVDINVSQINAISINDQEQNHAAQAMMTASAKEETELAEIHSLMKLRDQKGAKQPETSAEQTPHHQNNEMRITSGQANISQPNIVHGISKSASQPREIIPAQQSVIEEEGSQEDMEDSPNMNGTQNEELVSKASPRSDRYGRTIIEADGTDEDDMERDEDANIEEDNESIGEDDMIIEDEEGANDEDDEEMLLYERQISKNALLQITRSLNSQYIYQVRQKLVDQGQIQVITELSSHSVQSIAQMAKVSYQSLEEEQPELFEALAEYVIKKFIGHK